MAILDSIKEDGNKSGDFRLYENKKGTLYLFDYSKVYYCFKLRQIKVKGCKTVDSSSKDFNRLAIANGFSFDSSGMARLYVNTDNNPNFTEIEL